jgi:ABC-type glutathione transport system ATPase component
MKNVVGDRPKGQTVLAIAHRLSSIKDADLIIFLGKDGKIAEMGTWEKLLRIPNGKFAKFESVQNLKRAEKSDVAEEERDDHSDESANSSASGDSVSTNLSELSELPQQSNPLERTLDAVEALRLYVKTSGMPRFVMSSLNHACESVKEQQRVQASMSLWGASWTPYKEAEDLSKKSKILRQRSHLRGSSRGVAPPMLKQKSVGSSKKVHVSKHGGGRKKKNGSGLRTSSVF